MSPLFCWTFEEWNEVGIMKRKPVLVEWEISASTRPSYRRLVLAGAMMCKRI